MAAPVILPDQSAPQGFTNRAFGFRPAVLNSPNVWTTAGTFLPPGLTLDTVTGLVGGTPTLPGTYSFALQAGRALTLTTVVTVVQDAGLMVIDCDSTAGVDMGFPVVGHLIPSGATVNLVVSGTRLQLSVATLAVSAPTSIGVAHCDLWSTPMIFTMDVEQAVPSAPTGFLATVIDIGTNTVTFPSSPLTVKNGDDLLQQLTVKKYGVVMGDGLAVSSLKLGLKLAEGDDLILESGVYAQAGAGDATVYRHALTLADDALTGALDDEARALRNRLRDAVTHRLPDLSTLTAEQRSVSLLLLAEFEIKYANPGGIGRNPAVWTSPTFPVLVVRDLIPTT